MLARAPEFTSKQEADILRYYRDTPSELFNLAEFARLLGKSRQNISRFARKHGLTLRDRGPNAITHAAQKGKRWWKVHPRGMAGKKHNDETKRVLSNRSKEMWVRHRALGIGCGSSTYRQTLSKRMRAAAAARPAHVNYSRTKSGRRADLGGLFVRSSWEANYARYLNLLMRMGIVETWFYEPKTFWFDGIRRGVTNYKPDFSVKYKDDDRLEYVEIKGWIVAKDRVKWRRMAKFFPAIKLTVIKAKEYYALRRKWASSIPQWEHGKGEPARPTRGQS